MLTFIQFINENRIEFLKGIHKKIDSSHDTNALHHNSSSIIDHFATHADPSKNKQHTQWLIGQYKKKNIRQEDAARIHSALLSFDTHKAKLPVKDINSYKHISDLEDAISPHVNKPIELSARQQEKHDKTKGADLIHNDKTHGVTIHHIKTKQAAILYGKGTKWCTSAEKHNMFKRYKDGLHVIQHQNKKYQFHVGSEQLMDEKDKETDFTKIHPDIAKSLAKSSHPEIHNANFLFKNPHTKIDDSHVNSKHLGIRVQVAKHPEHAGKLVKDRHPSVRKLIAKHPEHAGKLVKDRHPEVRAQVAKHPEHAGKLINDPDPFVRAHVAKHPEHAGKLINDPDPTVKAHVADYLEHAGKLINDAHSIVRVQVAKHPEHAGKLINDAHPAVRVQVAKHPEHAGKLINDAHPAVREQAGATRRGQQKKK